MPFQLCPRKVYSVCLLLSPHVRPLSSRLTRIQVKFRPKFLESRRIGLEYFLKYALPLFKEKNSTAMIRLTPNAVILVVSS
jgi:hypothetical protein